MIGLKYNFVHNRSSQSTVVYKLYSYRSELVSVAVAFAEEVSLTIV